MREYIRLLRPWQWTKNAFIFLPLFFALQINDWQRLAKVGLAFVLFCVLASGIYIVNDYCDREEDRKHPQKKARPLAAGTVTGKTALTLAFVLAAVGLWGSGLLHRAMLYLALFYILLNLFYTIRLKHVPILDIFIIAVGFVIRIYVGGIVAQVQIYPWIVIMTFLIALFLALGKRRGDVLYFLNNHEKVRKSVDGYTLNFIDSSMVVMAAVTIVAYIMYTMSSEIIFKFKTDQLYMTSFFVILGIIRYLQIMMVEQRSSDPSEIILSDTFIQVAILGWITTFGLLIYLQ